MIRARLHQPAPQRKEEVARPKAQPPAVVRSARSARDPRFMRAVDRLQRTSTRRAPAAGGGAVDIQRLAYAGATPISSPHDPAEHEAEAIAHQVVTMPADEEALEDDARGDAAPAAPRAPATSPIARRGDGPTHASPALMNEIAAARPLGRPLPTHVRRFMEPRFRADFRGVRVHTGDHAARLSNRLNAHAFTLGNQVFFGRDRFNPDTHAGRHLIAHELTHTIQQRGAAQEPPVSRLTAAARVARAQAGVSSTEQPHVQRLGMDTILNKLADLANNIPGYRMFTIVLGVNPINMSTVDRSAANILRAIVEFMPGGGLIVQALDNYGVFDKVGGWIEGQLASLGLSGASIKASLMQFLDSLNALDFLNPGGVWDRAKAIFTTPIDNIISFAKSLAIQVLKFIKDAILRPLAELASQTPAWDLLIAVLGRNPITGDPVPRTADTMIGGFMKLIGQEEIWENIKKANAIPRAWAWFQGAIAGLMGFVQEIPGLFLAALQSLEIADIVLLPRAFVKVGQVFAGFFERFVKWAGQTIWDLLEIIFAVVAPGVMVYLRKAAAAFKTILRDPIGFVKNLIAAGKQGLQQFVKNFVNHLKAALIGWLTGSLSGAGVYIPQALSLPEIGKFVLSMLGITWAKIRGKIVAVIGDKAMTAIETGLDIVIALVKGGPAAAWEIIKQKLTDLKDMVIQSILSFVKDKIVSAAVTKLLSMLSPVGAFIQAIIGMYNTVMFFVERLKQIAAVAANVIDSISAIANGVIAAAANKVEQTMAGLLVLVISFLARIAGLGKVSDAVVNFLKMVQGKVDQAIDFAIKFVVDKAKAFLKGLFGKGDKKDERTPAQKQADLDKALAEAKALQTDPKATEASIKKGLAAIKTKYKMQSLDLVVDSQGELDETLHVVGQINPKGQSPSSRIQKDGTVGPLGIVRSMLSWAAGTLRALLKDPAWKKFQAIKGQYQEANLAIRHKVSISDTIKNTDAAIAPKKPDPAADMLATKGYPVEGKPKTKPKIVSAARDFLQAANNDLKNLFVGDARINSVVVKERYDAGDRGDPNAQKHVDQRADFVETWGFKDEEFVITMQRQSKRQGTTRQTETRTSKGTQDKKVPRR
jgi:hypothetical protein